MTAEADPNTPPPEHELMSLVVAAYTSQALYVAAKLGVADVLADGPASAEEIARRVGADPGGTYRLMRALSTRSIFQEEDHRFRLTPMSEPLRSDARNSVRAMVLVSGHPTTWETLGELTHSVTTGEPSFRKLHGMPVFDYLDQDREYARHFNEAMSYSSSVEIPELLEAFDFSRFGTIVDVGGGQGRLLAAILEAAPDSRGVLADLESVTASAPEVFEAGGVTERSTIHGGSFFDSVPDGGDAYVLKHILHDWPEPQALDILGRVREATAPDASLLLIELVLPADSSPHLGKLIDLDLLINFGGRHRTSEEYRDLLARAGFRMTGVTATKGAASIIEAVPA